ncbi:MAG TPA: carboxylating nicotinate-nucleotide diphosphorylase [Acidimicrobiales bacterium]|nr:carboxylating nicotinate-nucleotide diphosphorylase [Acidimicrobiales bacterium]
MHDAHPPVTAVREAVTRALAEDLTPIGDLTSALLPPALEATALLVPRSDGVLAGRLCADEAFRQMDPGLEVRWAADDGDRVTAGTEVGRVSGPLAPILTAERTALNFLGHLSGIATLTARFVDAVEGAGGHLRVWDTRKTTPGLRSLEKAAVRAGGGANHRGNLSDWVLLKDNHLELFGIRAAVAHARERWPARTVHVECGDLDQVREAVEAGADALLLDNMSPDEVRSVVAEVREHDPRRPLLEISGRISLETIRAYATTGADLVSIGALTHSAPVLDIGLDVVAD